MDPCTRLLCNLPEGIFPKLLEHLSVGDMLELAAISDRVEDKIIEARPLTEAEFYIFVNDDFLMIEFTTDDAKGDLRCVFTPNPKEVIPNHVKASKKYGDFKQDVLQMIEHRDDNFNTRLTAKTETPVKCAEDVALHLYRLFGIRMNGFELEDESFDFSHWIEKFGIKSLDHFWLDEDFGKKKTDFESKNLQKLLDSTPIIDTLNFYKWRLSPDFRMKNPLTVQTLEGASEWFTFDNLMMSQCKRISIVHTLLTPHQLNHFLVKWTNNECCENLEFLKVYGIEWNRKKRNTLFDGINLLPYDSTRNSEVFFFDADTTAGGKDIRRKDGMVATVLVGEDFLALTVWTPDRFKCNRPPYLLYSSTAEDRLTRKQQSVRNIQL